MRGCCGAALPRMRPLNLYKGKGRNKKEKDEAEPLQHMIMMIPCFSQGPSFFASLLLFFFFILRGAFLLSLLLFSPVPHTHRLLRSFRPHSIHEKPAMQPDAQGDLFLFFDHALNLSVFGPSRQTQYFLHTVRTLFLALL